MKRISNQPIHLLLLLIGTTFIIRLIIAYTTGLGIGEAYYFRGAVDLQLSYFDQPPFFFWVSGLFVKYFGLSNITLRLPAVVFFTGTTFFVYLSGKELFSEWAGFWAALTLNLSFVFTLPVAVWYQPDAALMFFWMVSIYSLIQLFFSKEKDNSGGKNNKYVYGWWILLGVSTGLASLSKYHSVFLIAGTVIFIVVNKKYRTWIKHPGPYLALIITLLLLLPVILWNKENNWVSFLFQGNRATISGGFELHPEWFIRNIIGQAVWLAPWIWYPLVVELFKSARKFRITAEYSFFFSLAILPIAFFTVITLWSNSQYHFHWQAPGYLVLFLPLGYSITHKLADHSRARKAKRWLIGSSSVLVFLSTVLILQMNTGFLQKIGPREFVQKLRGGHDPTLEGYDFVQIHERFEKEGWYNQKNLFVGTTRWWQTGKVDWALKGKKNIVVFDNDPRNYAFFSEPDKYINYDCVLVRFKSDGSIDYIKPFFSGIQKLKGIDIVRCGIKELEMDVFYCHGFRIPERYSENFPVYRQIQGKHPFYD
jgi:hypothetical protein